jgi:hypothetical protein
VAEDFLEEEEVSAPKRRRVVEQPAEPRPQEFPMSGVAHPLAQLDDPKDKPFQDEETDQEFHQIVTAHWGSIKTWHRCQKIVDIVNIRLWDPVETTMEANVEEKLRKAWNSFSCKAKANASVGCLLIHKTNGRMRYFHSCSNNFTLFEQPWLLESEKDLDAFLEAIASKDFAEESVRRRPDTEWKLYAVTNLTVYFYKLLEMSRIGRGDGEERNDPPNHIQKNRSVLGLFKNPKTGKPYQDNLCFFRCLAVARNCLCREGCCSCKTVSERTTRMLYREYLERMGETEDDEEFPGVDESDLLGLEDAFQVAIAVFSLDIERKAKVVWCSKRSFPKRLNLNLHNKHYSYIRNLDGYCNSYVCSVCDRCFDKSFNFRRHICATKEASKLSFRGGEFSSPSNIFTKLERECGIKLARDDPKRYYPYRITYDIESMLCKNSLPVSTDTTTYENVHSLLSVSVCSNVPGYKKPLCFVRDERGVENCVERFVTYLHSIAIKAESLLKNNLK